MSLKIKVRSKVKGVGGAGGREKMEERDDVDGNEP